jgi:alcohol dehydrogenase class IV
LRIRRTVPSPDDANRRTMRYTLLLPRKVVFGWGRRTEAGELARSLGRRAWIVSGSRTLQREGVLDELQQTMRQAGVESELLATATREPEVDDIDTTVAQLIEAGVREGDFVLGIGGGAGLDTAKAVAALATNRHGDSVRDFLEGVGAGLTIDHDPLPTLMMPTTAGTGTEATKNAVISSNDPPFKKSLRSEKMVPDVVLVDPELTVSCPPSVTAQSGMDAIAQLVESLISCRSNLVTRSFCHNGLASFVDSPVDTLSNFALVQAFNDPHDQQAREVMSRAALFSGIALANSGLGMAHGVAAALGVHSRVSHGLACAVMLPIALAANIGVMNEHDVWCLFHLTDDTGDVQTTEWTEKMRSEKRRRLPEQFRALNSRLGIPSRLGDLGVTAEQIPDIVRSSRGNSMDGNPRDITDEELDAILRANL